MKLLKSAILTLTMLAAINSYGQVVTTDPAFPSQLDTVIVYYHSDQGNGELDGVIPIYAHTGVITSNSSSPTDWQHVVGEWGQPDPQVLMTWVAPNLHKIEIPIQEFYGILPGEEVYKLAFVFRNVDGSLVGRNADGSDIFIDLYNEGAAAFIETPAEPLIVEPSGTFPVAARAISPADLMLKIDDATVAQETSDTLIEFTVNIPDYTAGTHLITFEAAFSDTTIRDTTYFSILSDAEIMPVPAGIREGINKFPEETDKVVFNFFAPGKQRIYVLGDFNNWQIDPDYLMRNDPSGDFHWLEVTGLQPSVEYRFQYFVVDDNLRFADPYSQKILDPWNDPWIPEETYPGLIPYPVDKTQGIVGVFYSDDPVFLWTDDDYVTPDETNLIVYELLIRDFLDAHDYTTLLDTLDYLERLGINAIELMPVNEFEGNISWGYNPDYYFAPDKYYGPKPSFQNFVNECHERGIAVIMDIAMNHSFGLNPQVMMYFDPNAGDYGQPTADNPWFNQIPKHDFNVGYDYNHESPYTKKFVDSVFVFWVDEYHIDGYRLDLSKGYTQTNTLGDINAWGQYDQSRIDILTSYGNHVWSYNPEAIIILEHFSVNSEESVLSDNGFLLWGNLNHEYTEGSMGYSSNLTWGSYQARGWNDPHLVTYMESHDEERMMYKNLTWGNSQGDYDVTDFETALKRSGLAAAFLFPIPGPKMIWQFGELGYDYSINTCEDGSINPDCKTAPKPIRWDYQQDEARNQLFEVYRELIRVKKEYPVFSTETFIVNLTGFQKTIFLDGEDMDAFVLGNFGMTEATMDVSFTHGGYWYDLISGDSLLAGDFVPTTIALQAGEYHLYTDVKIGDGIITGIEKHDGTGMTFSIYPNPSDGVFNVRLPQNRRIDKISIYTLDGKRVYSEKPRPGITEWKWKPESDIKPGMYFMRIESKNEVSTRKIILR